MSQSDLDAERVSAESLGFKDAHRRVWRICPRCGQGRWVIAGRVSVTGLCFGCHIAVRADKRRKNLNPDILRKLYYEDKLTPLQIAKYFGCSEGAVRNEMNRQGFTFRGLKEAHAHLFGEDNPAWKGGRYKAEDGYIMVYVGGRKHRPEHIVIWEQVNGRKLPKGWVIHHLNGIRDDNRIENLVALPRGGHSRLELAEAYKKRIRQLERQLRDARKNLSLPLE